MRVHLLIVISFFQCVFVTHARVIPKNSEEISKDSEENLKENSRERTGRSNNVFKFYKNIRLPRSSKEQTEKPKNVTKTNPKSKVALVKKPIPKFMDSEEDYQGKIRFPNKISDSAEHEDEDFNLDDYDFDVNHDEFSSRGKPLEPRKKIKVTKPKQRLEPAPAKLEPVLKPAISQSKVVLPRNVDKITYKVTRKAVDKMKEEEYDDEFPTSTKAFTSPKSTTTDDENSDENEDSKEYIAKGSGRSIRSPLSFGNYVDKWGEKTSDLMSKILTYLPMFPQVQEPRKLSEDVLEANSPMVDPLNGKAIF